MEEEFKKELTTLWERGGVKFNHFEHVTQEQCNKIIEETPKKYEKKITGSTFLQDQASTDSADTVDTTKNYTKQGVKQNCWAKILRYKSSQNKKASAIYDLVSARYNRTIDWVRCFL